MTTQPTTTTTPARARELTRQAEWHRNQADAARARGDTQESDLWTALAEEIDDYLSPGEVDVPLWGLGAPDE